MVSISDTQDAPAAEPARRRRPKGPTKLEAQQQRRAGLARLIRPTGPHTWLVPSDSRAGHTHQVDTLAGSCTCAFGTRWPGASCWHLQACRAEVERRQQAMMAELDALVLELGVERAVAALKLARVRRAVYVAAEGLLEAFGAKRGAGA